MKKIFQKMMENCNEEIYEEKVFRSRDENEKNIEVFFEDLKIYLSYLLMKNIYQLEINYQKIMQIKKNKKNVNLMMKRLFWMNQKSNFIYPLE